MSFPKLKLKLLRWRSPTGKFVFETDMVRHRRLGREWIYLSRHDYWTNDFWWRILGWEIRIRVLEEDDE